MVKVYTPIGAKQSLLGPIGNLPIKRGQRFVIPHGTVIHHDNKEPDHICERTYQATALRVLNGVKLDDKLTSPRVYWMGNNIILYADINHLALVGSFTREMSLGDLERNRNNVRKKSEKSEQRNLVRDAKIAKKIAKKNEKKPAATLHKIDTAMGLAMGVDDRETFVAVKTAETTAEAVRFMPDPVKPAAAPLGISPETTADKPEAEVASAEVDKPGEAAVDTPGLVTKPVADPMSASSDAPPLPEVKPLQFCEIRIGQMFVTWPHSVEPRRQLWLLQKLSNAPVNNTGRVSDQDKITTHPNQEVQRVGVFGGPIIPYPKRVVRYKGQLCQIEMVDASHILMTYVINPHRPKICLRWEQSYELEEK